MKSHYVIDIANIKYRYHIIKLKINCFQLEEVRGQMSRVTIILTMIDQVHFVDMLSALNFVLTL